MQVVEGIEDTHVKIPELLNFDPIAHYRYVPWYNLVALFYGQPNYHPLDHEIHATSTQGYALIEDPNEARWDMFVPNIYTFGVVSGLLVLFFMGLDNNVTKMPE